MVEFVKHLILILFVILSITSICIYIYCIKQRVRNQVNRIYRENLEQREMRDMLEMIEMVEREQNEEKNNQRDLQIPPLPLNSNDTEIQVAEATLELANTQVVFE